MDAGALREPFRATLEATLEGLRTLREILLAERRALTGRDVEALEQAVRQKRDCLAGLEHSVQAREQILSRLGLPGGLSGAEHFVEAHLDEADASLWRGLLSLSREVAELNTHNGKLAHAGERQAREALGILTGRPASSPVYSRRAGDRPSGGQSLGRC